MGVFDTKPLQHLLLLNSKGNWKY